MYLKSSETDPYSIFYKHCLLFKNIYICIQFDWNNTSNLMMNFIRIL